MLWSQSGVHCVLFVSPFLEANSFRLSDICMADSNKFPVHVSFATRSLIPLFKRMLISPLEVYQRKQRRRRTPQDK